MPRISAFFRRVYALFLAAITALLPMIPTKQMPHETTVSLAIPAVTTQTERFDVTIQNNTDSEISYGLDAFSIEKKTPVGWVTLPKRGDYAVIEILMLVGPGGTAEFNVNLPLVYGSTLSAGDYRFNFMFYAGDGGKKTVSETFSVVS